MVWMLVEFHYDRLDIASKRREALALCSLLAYASITEAGGHLSKVFLINRMFSGASRMDEICSVDDFLR